MSSPTLEEQKGLALAACFNDKRRHRRLIGHQARTFDFQFHPTEDAALSASEDGTARVWDLSGGRCAKSLEGHSKKHEVLRACWAPPDAAGNDAVCVATGSADGTVRLWGIPGNEGGDGDSGEGKTGIDRYESLKVVGQLRHRNQAKGLDGQVYSCHFIPDPAGDSRGDSPPSASGAAEMRLLTASDSSVHLWDVETQKRVATRALSKVGDHSIGGERNPDDASFVFDARPRPGSGSSALAVALSDGTVRVGDMLREGAHTEVLRGPSNTHLTSLAWSDDGAVLVSCGGNGTVTVWDARTWRARSVLSGHSRPVYGAGFYPVPKGALAPAGAAATAAASSGQESSPQVLLSWSSDETVCAWDVTTATGDATPPLATLAMEEGFPVYSCSVSPDGRRFAVAGGGGGAKKAGFLGVPIKLVDLSDSATEGNKQSAGERDA
ncbi:unnamed protein product [Scytosiphon promiscuus]